uniref:Kinesin motor domain-containing protein n=1 Tax=Macrostomum lignano TaxID=282301 RepID=A0A1I8IEW0_9PLAT
RTGIGRGVAGGRSRLHLIDLGCGRGGRDAGHPALSLAAMGSVLAALVNGQRRVPHRDSKLSQLLREALGSTGCRACMICQVSSMQQHASESMQILQFANRIQRMRKRRARMLGGSGGGGSGGGGSTAPAATASG